MKLLATLNPEHVAEEVATTYAVREASRAVVLDSEGKIALLHIARDRYYKLPGGGIEQGENTISALRRECREEIGCEIEVVGELGVIVEYRKFCSLKQISYCYLAKVSGSKGEPHLEPSEIEEGAKSLWVTPQESLELLTQCDPIGIEGKLYIVPRDLLFLKTAEKTVS